MTAVQSIRESAVAGLFYPALPAALNRDIEQLLGDAKPQQPKGAIRALICPHAGYVYSGSTAAMGYKLLTSKRYDAIVIVGPSHKEYFPGISIFPGDAYRTPLGEVKIDTNLRDELLLYSKDITLSDAGHRTEHAIEVQLPFLQKVLRQFTFLPVVMGDQSRETCDMLVEALTASVGTRNILLVASSDLSHYHTHNEALKLDRKVLEDVESFNPDRLMDRLEQHEVEACGGGPMVVVMKAARKLGVDKAHILQYCTSGDISGEKDAVVGYLSVVMTGAN